MSVTTEVVIFVLFLAHCSGDKCGLWPGEGSPPWHADLFHLPSHRHICSGALVHTDLDTQTSVVLTMARCLERIYTNMSTR